MDAEFANTFPLPFRAIFLVDCGILGWALNLHGLRLAGIDAESILDVSDRQQGHGHLYRSIYRLAIAFSLWTGIVWYAFRSKTYTSVASIDEHRLIPAIGILTLVAAAVNPTRVFYSRERTMFLRSLKRCFMAKGRPHFADVVLADILTSYAKVLGDFCVSGNMLLPGGSLTSPQKLALSRWVVPCIMSLPYILRFRQCLWDFAATTSRHSDIPLCNAIKYLTAFPVIFLSTMQLPSQGLETGHSVWLGELPLFRLWLLSIAINSLYSFWWDITYDWGFSLLGLPGGMTQRSQHIPIHNHSVSVSSTSPSYTQGAPAKRDAVGPWGLRAKLKLFSSPLPYYVIVAFNLVLRLTWSLKLSPHLHSAAELQSGVFLIEGLEVLRRWLWVFLRFEWELLKPPASETHASPAIDMLVLDPET